jgi:uncharacterized membrane protein
MARHLNGNMDLLALALANLLLLLLVYLLPLEPARVALGALLVIFFPGYALVSALYPGRDGLDGVERMALGFGLSLALVPLLGLALHFSSWGIALTPTITALTLLTLALAGIAWWRRLAMPSRERFGGGWQLMRFLPLKGLGPVDLVIRGGLALLVLGAMGALAWKAQSAGPSTGFTEFYVLGVGGVLEDYPTDLRVGQGQEYNVGVVNQEGAPTAYTVRAYLGNFVVGSVGPLVLKDGERWDGRIVVTPLVEGHRQRLELRLFQDQEVEAYHRVHLFVDVLSAKGPST